MCNCCLLAKYESHFFIFDKIVKFKLCFLLVHHFNLTFCQLIICKAGCFIYPFFVYFFLNHPILCWFSLLLTVINSASFLFFISYVCTYISFLSSISLSSFCKILLCSFFQSNFNTANLITTIFCC